MRAFTAYPAIAALTITELNPLHGERMAHAGALRGRAGGGVAVARCHGAENAVSQDPERRPAGWAWIVIRLMFPLRANPG
ncbi:MAG: hypothetical protein R2853_05345 [Thermomicrobiales bacterium]